MFKRIYIEITNICNLACSFCHGTRRAPKEMTVEEFKFIAERVCNKGKEFFLHIMGEPLGHSNLEQILEIAKDYKMPVTITTNGTLLGKRKEILLNAQALRKISISLHSFEGAIIQGNIEEYIRGCVEFAKECAINKKICVLRLWNLDSAEEKGANSNNQLILKILKEEFPENWAKAYNGSKLAEYIFLEWGEIFRWPDLTEPDYGETGFCYGLKTQIGILAEGTVVPCCLDGDGVLALGNIFKTDFEEIISSPTALEIVEGFNNRKVKKELCRKCGYARRFKI